MRRTSDQHPFRLGSGISSRFSPEELRRRLAAVDLVATDIDECLYPGFSQSHLGHMILLQIATRPRAATDVRFIPQLVHGGAYIRKVQLLRLLGREPSNAALMRRYEHSMWAIPEHYFLDGARRIPPRLFDGVPETLSLLGRKAPVGLVSFGIHLIADELRRQLNQRTGHALVGFVEANRIVFQLGPDGRSVFAGYDPPPRTAPCHKREALERQLALHGARCPLVLGNGRDECEMASLAGQRGGLSIGFHPGPSDEACFDVVVRSKDWRPVAVLVEALNGSDAGCENPATLS